MIKLIVEINEVNKEGKATNIAFRSEREHPTDVEKFWEDRLSPVLKEALNRPGLLGEAEQNS